MMTLLNITLHENTCFSHWLHLLQSISLIFILIKLIGFVFLPKDSVFSIYFRWNARRPPNSCEIIYICSLILAFSCSSNALFDAIYTTIRCDIQYSLLYKIQYYSDIGNSSATWKQIEHHYRLTVLTLEAHLRNICTSKS